MTTSKTTDRVCGDCEWFADMNGQGCIDGTDGICCKPIESVEEGKTYYYPHKKRNETCGEFSPRGGERVNYSVDISFPQTYQFDITVATNDMSAFVWSECRMRSI